MLRKFMHRLLPSTTASGLHDLGCILSLLTKVPDLEIVTAGLWAAFLRRCC